MSLCDFLQMHGNLNLSQNKKFNFKKGKIKTFQTKNKKKKQKSAKIVKRIPPGIRKIPDGIWIYTEELKAVEMIRVRNIIKCMTTIAQMLRERS